MRPPVSLPHIKCCGITSLVDVQSVVALGYHYAGFIRVPHTSRYVSPEFLKEASLYTTGGSTTMVGVYQNAPISLILEDVHQVPGLSVIQLHGEETLEDIIQLHGELPEGVIIWKVFDLLSPPEDVTIAGLAPYIQAVVLDLPKGFTEAFDWLEDATAQQSVVLEFMAVCRRNGLLTFLAGRLTPALAGGVIERYQPDGLDVASGVESLPGQKDYALLQAFIHRAL
jgi:phosphoribosylanthranilate isomerase